MNPETADNPTPPEEALKPARLRYRILAFGFDTILCGMFLTMLLYVFILPNHYSQELNELNNIIEQYHTEAQAGADMSQHIINSSENNEPIIRISVAFLSVYLFGFWAYFSLTEPLSRGSSLGKKMFSLSVVRLQNREAPNLFESVCRGGTKTIAILTFFQNVILLLTLGTINFLLLLFIANYLIVFRTRNQRAGHDFFAGTMVIEPPGFED